MKKDYFRRQLSRVTNNTPNSHMHLIIDTPECMVIEIMIGTKDIHGKGDYVLKSYNENMEHAGAKSRGQSVKILDFGIDVPMDQIKKKYLSLNKEK